MGNYIPDELKPIYRDMLDKIQAIQICDNTVDSGVFVGDVINKLRESQRYNNTVDVKRYSEQICIIRRRWKNAG